MHLRPVWLVALAALGAAAVRSAELTELPPASGAGIERGVALLRCTDPESAILRLTAPRFSTSARLPAPTCCDDGHGLPSHPEAIERDCRVLVRGKEYAIDAVWHAGSHASGPEHDWTVLLLGERIKGDLLRWRAAEVAESWLEELVAGNARVRLVLRYADAAQTDCRLESWASHRLLAHSCVSYPGTSGSPLAVARARSTSVLASNAAGGPCATAGSCLGQQQNQGRMAPASAGRQR